MSAYLVGNLVGRLVVSYLLVVGINLLLNRFELSNAVRRTHRPWGVAAVVGVFLIGMLGRLVA